jgi:WhiB family redox-sensing transcriptional regulator
MSAEIINFGLAEDQSWAKWAVCARYGAAGMYPSDQDREGIAAAKANCDVCPVRAECLTEALRRGEQWGIWGGLTTDERNGFQRRNTRKARQSGEVRKSPVQLADDINVQLLDVAS